MSNYTSIYGDYNSTFYDYLAKKFGKSFAVDGTINGKKINASDAEKTVNEAADEATKIAEENAQKKLEKDEYYSQVNDEQKENTEKIEAQTKDETLDNDLIELYKKYKEMYGDGTNVKSDDEIALQNYIKEIQAQLTDNKYHTYSTDEKASNAIVLDNKIEDADKKAEETKKRQETEEKKESEKSVAEDVNKEPEINPFMDMQKNPFEQIFDVTEELDKELEDAV